MSSFGSRGDDATAALLRETLRRQAASVRVAPPSAEGLGRILAAARASAPTVEEAPATRRPRTGPDATSPAASMPLVARLPGQRQRPLTHWLPMLAAAAAVIVVAGGLGLVRFGVLNAPGLNAVLDGGAAPAAPAPHPPTADPLPVYLVEHQNDRWALVREFTPTTLTAPTDRLRAAVRLAVTGTSADSDHTSVWRAVGLPVTEAGAASAVDVVQDAGGGLTIRLPSALLGATEEDAGAPPASLAVQQLVWTVTATARSSTAVRIVGPTGAPGATLLGTVPLDHTFTRSPRDPRAPVWVSSLVDGQRLATGHAMIQGDAVTTSTGNVPWRLLTAEGTEVMSGVAQLLRESGGVPEPGERAVWQVEVQLPGAGRYQFKVSQPWPEDAVAGHLPWTDTDWVDTKTLVVS